MSEQVATRLSWPLRWLSAIATLACVVLVGCGGSMFPVVGTVSFPNGKVTSVAPGAVVAMASTVTNDVKGLGVDWSVTCTPPKGTTIANACGSFSPSHTASGAFTNFTAPYAIPVSTAVSITATSTADPTRKTQMFMTIAGAALTVSVTPSVANVEVNGQAQFTATVANDPANAGVTWTLACSANDCGQLAQPPQTSSGTPISYVGPAAIPNGGVFLTATSVTNPTVFTQVSVNIVPAIVVNFFTAPPTTLAPGASTSLIATVTNDFGNAGVLWSATTIGGATAGSFSVAQTASGGTTVYSAAGVPVGTPVIITAASITDPNRTVTATITIAYNISVAISSAVTTMPAGSTASFAAIVVNDSLSGGVTWSSTAGGSFNPQSTPSGVATVYTAPPAIPTGGTVTITATSATDPTQHASVPVTITAPPIAIAIASPGPILQIGTSAAFAAVVTNDPTSSGVTWKATAGAFNPGQTLSGGATIYTAPSTVPTPSTVTITATSVADKSISATVNITISQTAPSIIVTVSPTTATVLPGGATQFTATVANDSANAGVNWTVNPSTAGAVSPTFTPTGVQTTFTASSTAPTGTTATLTATSVTDSNSSGSANITISTPNNNALLSGHYAFSMTGQNYVGGSLDTSYESYLGSITASGDGKITAGEVDFNSSALPAGSVNVPGLTGNYTLDSSGHGTIIVSNTALQYSLTLSVTMVTGSHGLIASAVDNGNNSQLYGSIDKQATNLTAPNGTFAFTFALPYSGGNGIEPDDLGGVLTVTSGNITNYQLDENDGGTATFTSTQASDSFLGLDNNGRGTITLSNFGSSQTGSLFVYYIVDPTHFLIGTTIGGGGVGNAYLQPATLPSSLAGTYAFTQFGYGVNTGTLSYINAGGIFTCDANGNLTQGTLDVNDSSGTPLTGPISGSCALDPSPDGRGTIVINGGGIGGISNFAVYPTATNGYLMLDLDSTATGVGVAYPQTSGAPFTGSYAASFFTQNSNSGSATLLGTVTASGATAPLAGMVDISDFQELNYTSDVKLSGKGNPTAPVSGRLTGEFTTAPTPGSLTYDMQQIFYIVDQNTVLSLESDSNPGIGILQLQSLTTP